MKPLLRKQAAASVGLLALAGVFAVGAASLSSEAGYGGVGPNFLPGVVSVVLAACGAVLLWQALKGGWPVDASAASDGPDATPDWASFAWVSAGLLANAAFIQSIGFILSCALCFALAARGFRLATQAKENTMKSFGVDLGLGAAIAAPVFWLFTLALNVNLPGLTKTGWL